MAQIIQTHIVETTGEVVQKTQPVFLRTPYNYDMNAASDESGLYCPEPTRTQQQFKDEVDINTIVRQFGLTGQMPENLNERMPLTGDFTTHVTDFQTAQNMVRQATEAFMELPAHIRAEFDNNPQKFLDFVENPKNKERAKDLGMLKEEPKTPEPQLVKIVSDTPPPGDGKTPA